MDSTRKPLPAVVDPEQVHRSMKKLGGMGAVLINLLMVVWFWGHWSVVAGVVALIFWFAFVNVWFAEWMAKRYRRTHVEWMRLVGSVLGNVVAGWVTDWSVFVWLYVPYTLVRFYGLDGWNHVGAVLFVLGLDVAALLSGCDPLLPLAFSVLGGFVYLMSEKRDLLLRATLQQVLAQREELERAHHELQQMHQRALAQEKLSSLGMLAAGMAHEINNPMSFVTSNVHTMLRHLQERPALPEDLKEYVDEVLPETLDGVKRVNAIVADLRRFARGDPEAHVEYDLDNEVRTALRLSHGKLNHCRVETSLGGVGTLLGRPQQLVQVLVNLLVNAGQATPPGGHVCISTHQDGEQVRVVVRDTGVGMSEETQRHLFQPFFTTKPPGEGTGLGLAVVHGIVTAHGGRIEVESAPGQGTCFTVHLPRNPPLPRYGLSLVSQTEGRTGRAA
jgi:signal transduction histidine kinase